MANKCLNGQCWSMPSFNTKGGPTCVPASICLLSHTHCNAFKEHVVETFLEDLPLVYLILPSYRLNKGHTPHHHLCIGAKMFILCKIA